MSWDLFTSIVNQFDGIQRVVLHGVGEPMLVKDLPERIEFLKKRGIYVLFNTNGTLLNEANGERLLNTGLDELRVSLDAAESSVFQMVRGRDMFDRIVRNLTRVSPPAARARRRISACFTLAHRAARNNRATGGLCSLGSSDRRAGSLPPASGFLQ